MCQSDVIQSLQNVRKIANSSQSNRSANQASPVHKSLIFLFILCRPSMSRKSRYIFFPADSIEISPDPVPPPKLCIKMTPENVSHLQTNPVVSGSVRQEMLIIWPLRTLKQVLVSPLNFFADDLETLIEQVVLNVASDAVVTCNTCFALFS